MSRDNRKSDRNLKAAPPTDSHDAENPERLLEQSETLEPFDEKARSRFGHLISAAVRKRPKRRKPS
jgi:hypothetical protein